MTTFFIQYYLYDYLGLKIIKNIKEPDKNNKKSLRNEILHSVNQADIRFQIKLNSYYDTSKEMLL